MNLRFDDRKVMTKIATLYYLNGWNQAKIAKKYKVSRPVISKVLQKAKSNGIIEVYIKDESYHTVDLEINLEKKYNLKDVIVVPNHNLTKEMESKNIGKAASSYVSNLLGNDTKLGISWGKTLLSFVEEFPYQKNETVRVIPLVGGMGRNKVSIHSNQLANQLANKLGSECTYLYAPAIVQSEDLKNRLVETEDCALVLEESKNVDIAVVGIGNPYHLSTMKEIGYLSEEDIEEIEKQSVIGDINSNFFTDKLDNSFPEINDRVIGVSIGELKKINNVICIGHGDYKVKSIHIAALQNWFDVLITDEKTGNQLLKQ